MDILDLLIVALVGLLAWSGFRRGLTWGGLSTVGLILGSLAGALIAPPITRLLTGNANNGQSHQPLVAAGIFLACVLIIQGVGTAVGYRVRARSLKSRFSTWDSVAGSVAGGFGALFTVWFLGFVFVGGTTPWLSDEVRGSGIERALARVGPTPPGFLAKIQQLVRDENFPNPFSGFNQGDLPAQPIPPQVNTEGVNRAAKVVSRVVATSSNSGCPGGEAGSAWPIGGDRMVTNAHVVAASDHIEVDTPDGRTLPASLVLFDPDVDVAILDVPGANLSALPISTDVPAAGLAAAAIGYPNGLGEQKTPAAVNGVEDAFGPNIYYDGHNVTRNIVVVSANVIPGDSGGPLVNLNGQVIGLTFASSTDKVNVGYALSVAQITPVIRDGAARDGSQSSGGCPRA